MSKTTIASLVLCVAVAGSIGSCAQEEASPPGEDASTAITYVDGRAEVVLSGRQRAEKTDAQVAAALRAN